MKKIIIFTIFSFILILCSCNSEVTVPTNETIDAFPGDENAITLEEYYSSLNEVKLEYDKVLIEFEYNNYLQDLALKNDDIEKKQIHDKYYEVIKSLLLSTDEVENIKTIYSDSYKYVTANDVNIQYYLGKYNGYYACMIKDDEPNIDIQTINIGGYEFNTAIPSIKLFNDVRVISLKEAYDDNIINKDELYKLYTYHSLIFNKFLEEKGLK